MNDLITIYELFKEFGDNHNLISEFKLIGSLEELQTIEVKHRGLYVHLDGANLSRLNNNPVYEISFNVIVVDKVPLNEDLALMHSNQENIFVISQLQDYFGQNMSGEERFQDVNAQGFSAEDFNITTATTSCSFVIARNPYNREIDL